MFGKDKTDRAVTICDYDSTEESKRYYEYAIDVVQNSKRFFRRTTVSIVKEGKFNNLTFATKSEKEWRKISELINRPE